jgi:hypothetical protein
MIKGPPGARQLEVDQLTCAGSQVLSSAPIDGFAGTGRYALRATGTLAADDVVLWWSDGDDVSGMRVSTTGVLARWSGDP